MPWRRLVASLLAMLAGFGSGVANADTIFLIRRGWHIDIGFDSADLVPPLRAAAAEFPGARYVLFGFGDRRYLESKHHGGATMLRALWPGPGVLLGTGLIASPEAAFGATHVLRFYASVADSAATQRFVWNSFTTQQAGLMGSGHAGLPGPYDGASYFDSQLSYSAGRTCNTWAAQALAVSQAPIHSRGVLFAGQLWGQARREAAAP